MAKMGRPCIYGLLHPDTGELRYIGKADNPKARLSSHMRDSRRRRTPLYDWINSLGRAPEMVVLKPDCEDWQESERALIQQARSSGARLLNLADGGDQPGCTVETRRANAKTMNRILGADPVRKMARDLNRRLSIGYKQGHLSADVLGKLRRAAAMRPDLFGMWKNA